MRKSDAPTYMSPKDAAKMESVTVEKIDGRIHIFQDREWLSYTTDEARALVTKLTLLLAGAR